MLAGTEKRSTLSVLKKFAATVLPGVIKPLHALWNEIIGFLFIVLAVIAIRPVWRAHQRLVSGELNGTDVLVLICGLVFLVLGVFFGIQGFMKARRISRS
jgi:hypothetical protein